MTAADFLSRLPGGFRETGRGQREGSAMIRALRRWWWACHLRRLERRIDPAHFDRELSLKIDALIAKLESEK